MEGEKDGAEALSGSAASLKEGRLRSRREGGRTRRGRRRKKGKAGGREGVTHHIQFTENLADVW